LIVQGSYLHLTPMGSCICTPFFVTCFVNMVTITYMKVTYPSRSQCFSYERKNDGKKLTLTKIHTCNSKINSFSGIVSSIGIYFVFTVLFYDVPLATNKVEKTDEHLTVIIRDP
jgi:hypothetical protein